MMLHFSLGLRSTTIAWHRYATLRDNVQHHAEQAKPTPQYEMLHAVEKAVDDGRIELDAGVLHRELLHAWYALAETRSRDVAVGNRTLAIMLELPSRPTVGRTVSVLEMGHAVPEAPNGYLCHLFTQTFQQLFSLTARARPGETLTVTRIDKNAPRPRPLPRFPRNVAKDDSGQPSRGMS